MKKLMTFAALAAVVLASYSCNKIQEETISEKDTDNPSALTTKALGDKSPALAVYIEMNDVNPLNAGDYKIGSVPLFDIVELFASNIHKETVAGLSAAGYNYL